MIFAISNHIEQIIEGEKTQTRRQSPLYLKGRDYSIQRGRGRKGIKAGRILITERRCETKLIWTENGWTRRVINIGDAKAEGGYSPQEFEELYEKIHPTWRIRYAYSFIFVPTELIPK